MAVIRLTHVADLPDPETLMRRLQSLPLPSASAGPAAPAGRPQGPAMTVVRSTGLTGVATAPMLTEGAVTQFARFQQIVDLIREKRDMKLLVEVETGLRLVHYAPGRIEFQPTDAAPTDLAARLAQRLQAWTGARWGVSVVNSGGAETVAESRDNDRLTAAAEAMQSPLVQAVIAAFPGARISAIRTPEALAQAAAIAALPEVDEDWDPFEDD